MGRVSLGHYLLGLQGLALLRGFFTGTAADARARVREMTDLLGRPDEPPLGLEFEISDEDVASGYTRWATSYDGLPNPLIRLEEPVMRALIDRSPPGIAVDAACGTGRHAAHLQERGHRVVGVDGSDAMLARARARVPAAEFRAGDLSALPLPDAGAHLVVCALALTHCARLDAPLRELARVLRPGGRLLLSDFHPMQLLIGGTALFIDADGGAGHVRSHFHTHGAYLAAFRAAGLQVVDCVEPLDGDDEILIKAGGVLPFAPEACRAALRGLPGVLIWDLLKPARP